MTRKWLRMMGRVMLSIAVVILCSTGFNAANCLSSSIAGAETVQSADHQPEMQPEYIDELAARTTVVIAQDLLQGDVETGQAFEPGSGAIVAKADDLYFVVTNLHVVPLTNVVYGIRTFDGEVHTVQPDDRAFGIYRLGKQIGETVQGLDIAIIVFQSDRDYPVAGVNLTDRLSRGNTTFVSGWPESPNGQPMERRLEPGEIANVTPPSPDGGYGLFYTSHTAVGMSGGPVFNDRGEVIGIHGRGFTAATQGANQGIQSNRVATEAMVVKQAERLLSDFDFVTQSPDPETIASWRTSRPDTADIFDNPEQAFREAFRSSALRDCSPSRVDTGDPEDICP